jgi:hypothetical protein
VARYSACWFIPVRGRVQAQNGIQDWLERAGLAVVTEAHGLTCDGAQYFGLLQVTHAAPETDFGLVVGLRNSHDRSFPAGLVVGASVLVCDNHGPPS